MASSRSIFPDNVPIVARLFGAAVAGVRSGDWLCLTPTNRQLSIDGAFIEINTLTPSGYYDTMDLPINGQLSEADIYSFIKQTMHPGPRSFRYWLSPDGDVWPKVGNGKLHYDDESDGQFTLSVTTSDTEDDSDVAVRRNSEHDIQTLVIDNAEEWRSLEFRSRSSRWTTTSLGAYLGKLSKDQIALAVSDESHEQALVIATAPDVTSFYCCFVNELSEGFRAFGQYICSKIFDEHGSIDENAPTCRLLAVAHYDYFGSRLREAQREVLVDHLFHRYTISKDAVDLGIAALVLTNRSDPRVLELIASLETQRYGNWPALIATFSMASSFRDRGDKSGLDPRPKFLNQWIGAISDAVLAADAPTGFFQVSGLDLSDHPNQKKTSINCEVNSSGWVEFERINSTISTDVNTDERKPPSMPDRIAVKGPAESAEQRKKRQQFEKRKLRTRKQLKKVANGRPRLSVFRSNKNIYAQIIDDNSGRTIAAASSLEKELKCKLDSGGNKYAASLVGRIIGERAISEGVSEVVFDRGAYQYHGRVAALADAARATGLQF